MKRKSATVIVMLVSIIGLIFMSMDMNTKANVDVGVNDEITRESTEEATNDLAEPTIGTTAIEDNSTPELEIVFATGRTEYSVNKGEVYQLTYRVKKGNIPESVEWWIFQNDSEATSIRALEDGSSAQLAIAEDETASTVTVALIVNDEIVDARDIKVLNEENESEDYTRVTTEENESEDYTSMTTEEPEVYYATMLKINTEDKLFTVGKKYNLNYKLLQGEVPEDVEWWIWKNQSVNTTYITTDNGTSCELTIAKDETSPELMIMLLVNGNVKDTKKILIKQEPIQNISLSKQSLTMVPGTVAEITANISPKTTTQSKELVWKSNNKKVAIVEDGTVVAIAKGTATITAKTKNGKTANCSLTVGISISKITLNKTKTTIKKGKTTTLKATISPSNTTDSKTITWISDNKKIATVSSKGVVKGIKKGKATITAKTSNGKTATCIVTIK